MKAGPLTSYVVMSTSDDNTPTFNILWCFSQLKHIFFYFAVGSPIPNRINPLQRTSPKFAILCDARQTSRCVYTLPSIVRPSAVVCGAPRWQGTPPTRHVSLPHDVPCYLPGVHDIVGHEDDVLGPPTAVTYARPTFSSCEHRNGDRKRNIVDGRSLCLIGMFCFGLTENDWYCSLEFCFRWTAQGSGSCHNPRVQSLTQTGLREEQTNHGPGRTTIIYLHSLQMFEWLERHASPVPQRTPW